MLCYLTAYIFTDKIYELPLLVCIPDTGRLLFVFPDPGDIGLNISFLLTIDLGLDAALPGLEFLGF